MIGRKTCRSLLIGVSFVAAGPSADATAPDWGSDSSEKPDEVARKREPSSSVENLGYVISDLRTSSSPDPLWPTVVVESRYPYQAVALGCTLEVYASPWLRLQGTYSIGMAGIAAAPHVANYGELLAGVAVLRVASDTEVNLAVRHPFSGRVTLLPVPVPTYHALFVEVGGITGFIQPSRCEAHCDADYSVTRTWMPEDHQLVMGVAGIRYVYFWSARSEQARTERTVHAQFYLHLIGKPVNPPKHAPLFHRGEPIESALLGWRVGFEAPPFCADCKLRLGMSFGYNPLPKVPMIAFHFTL